MCEHLALVYTEHGLSDQLVTYHLPADHRGDSIGRYNTTGTKWTVDGRGRGQRDRDSLSRFIVPVPGSTTGATGILVCARDVCTKNRAGVCTYPGCKFSHFKPGCIVTALPGQTSFCVGMASQALKANNALRGQMEYTSKQKAAHTALIDDYVNSVKETARLKTEEHAEQQRDRARISAAEALIPNYDLDYDEDPPLAPPAMHAPPQVVQENALLKAEIFLLRKA